MDELLKHLYIDFFYKTKRRFFAEHCSNLAARTLNEKYGLPNNIDNIANTLLKSINNSNSSPIKVPICDSWIDNVNVFLIKSDYIDASYIPSKSRIFLIDKEYKFSPLAISVNIDNSDNNKFVSLLHELTHAFEDYKRSTNKRQSLLANGNEYGYHKNIASTNDVNEKIISKILYYLYQAERNAFISSMVGEFKNCNKYFSSIRELTYSHD